MVEELITIRSNNRGYIPRARARKFFELKRKHPNSWKIPKEWRIDKRKKNFFLVGDRRIKEYKYTKKKTRRKRKTLIKNGELTLYTEEEIVEEEEWIIYVLFAEKSFGQREGSLRTACTCFLIEKEEDTLTESEKWIILNQVKNRTTWMNANFVKITGTIEKDYLEIKKDGLIRVEFTYHNKTRNKILLYGSEVDFIDLTDTVLPINERVPSVVYSYLLYGNEEYIEAWDGIFRRPTKNELAIELDEGEYSKEEWKAYEEET